MAPARYDYEWYKVEGKHIANIRQFMMRNESDKYWSSTKAKNTHHHVYDIWHEVDSTRREIEQIFDNV